MRQMVQKRRCLCLTDNSFLWLVLLLLSVLLMVHSAPTPASPLMSKEIYKEIQENTPDSIIESTVSSFSDDIKISFVDKEGKSNILEFISPKNDLLLNPLHQQGDMNKKETNEMLLTPLRVEKLEIEQNRYLSVVPAASIPNVKITIPPTRLGNTTQESLSNVVDASSTTTISSIDSYIINSLTVEGRNNAKTSPASLSSVQGQVTQSNWLIPLTFTLQPQSSTLSSSSLSNNENPPNSSQPTILFSKPSTLQAKNIDLKVIEKPNRDIKINDFDGTGTMQASPNVNATSIDNNKGSSSSISNDYTEKGIQNTSEDMFSAGKRITSITKTSETAGTTENVKTSQRDEKMALQNNGASNVNTKNISVESSKTKLDQDGILSSAATGILMKSISSNSTGFLSLSPHHKASTSSPTKPGLLLEVIHSAITESEYQSSPPTTFVSVLSASSSKEVDDAIVVNTDVDMTTMKATYEKTEGTQNNNKIIVEQITTSTSRDDATLRNITPLKTLLDGIEPETSSSIYPLVNNDDSSNHWDAILSKSTSAVVSVGSNGFTATVEPYLINATNSSNTDDDNLNDDIFDVIIDDNRSAIKTTSTEAIEISDKLLEADSEEFFVPEDIKERETTTILATTTIVESLPIDTEVPQIATDIDDELLRPNPSTINHEADTIFYISNTEVKVVESVPTPNTNQESQFFPVTYEEDVIIDFSSKNFTGWVSIPDKYEEDIILSPLKNNFDPERMIDGGGSDDNLSISYIGESFIEVKEFTSDSGNAVTPVPPLPEYVPSNVIIQPVEIFPQQHQQQQPQISVPIIAELPPQIGSNIILYQQFEQQQKLQSPKLIHNKELYVGDNQLPYAVATEPNGNGLIQNSLQINQFNAELPLMINDPSQLIDGKSIPAKRNNGQSNVTSSNGGSVRVGGIEVFTSGPLLSNTAFSSLDDEPEHSEFIFLGEYTLFHSLINIYIVLFFYRIYGSMMRNI